MEEEESEQRVVIKRILHLDSDRVVFDLILIATTKLSQEKIFCFLNNLLD